MATSGANFLALPPERSTATITELRILAVRRELRLAREQLEAALVTGDEGVIHVWERTVRALERREHEALR